MQADSHNLCPHGRPLISPPSTNGVLKLVVQGIGPVPTKKNSKEISHNHKTGKPFLRTRDDIQAWIEAAIIVLQSELNSAYRTAVATGTAACPLCWIASSVPGNDSGKHIRKGAWELTDVPEGKEGAVISIERYAREISPTEAAQLYSKFYDDDRHK